MRTFQNDIFRDDLISGENILWSGQADPSINFNKADIFLMPFGIVFVLFALGYVHQTMGTLNLSLNQIVTADTNALPNLALSALFFLMGAYNLVGRFIVKKWRKKNTYYAVTNKRILIASRFLGHSLQSEYINALSGVTKNSRACGTGTLVFQSPSIQTNIRRGGSVDFQNAGMIFRRTNVPAFFDIKDADKVYKIVSDLRDQPANEQNN